MKRGLVVDGLGSELPDGRGLWRRVGVRGGASLLGGPDYQLSKVWLLSRTGIPSANFPVCHEGQEYQVDHLNTP